MAKLQEKMPEVQVHQCGSCRGGVEDCGSDACADVWAVLLIALTVALSVLGRCRELLEPAGFCLMKALGGSQGC